MEEVIVETSVGVKFRLYRPPVQVITAIEKQLEGSRPQPPTVYIEEKDRSEPNESDPHYQEALSRWSSEVFFRQFEVVVSTACEVVEMPKNLKGVDDDWEGPFEILGIPISRDGRKRFLEWVKFVAAPDFPDQMLITAKGLGTLGVTEEEVAEAVESFRSRAERPANSAGTDLGHDSNLDNSASRSRNSRSTVRRVERNV